MWQKIKCWLGWHEWGRYCSKGWVFGHCFAPVNCAFCRYHSIRCKHCGKVKQ